MNLIIIDYKCTHCMKYTSKEYGTGIWVAKNCPEHARKLQGQHHDCRCTRIYFPRLRRRDAWIFHKDCLRHRKDYLDEHGLNFPIDRTVME